jgi:diacylglycerol kinase family enzyme
VQSSVTNEVHISRYPRDAVAVVHRYIAKTPADETVRVYAVGGDGILFDCLNGMADFKNAELTHIPYGKSNVFVRVFGKDAEKKFKDIRALINGTPHPMDIIHCGKNYALSHVAVGLEAQAVITANAFLRRHQSRWARHFIKRIYVLAGFFSVFNQDVMQQDYQLIIDGENATGRFFNINMANGACSAGDMVISPNAIPNDGLMNVQFAKRSNRPLSIFKAIPAYTRGNYKNKKFFRTQEAKEVTVTSKEPIRVHIDGEAFFTYKLRLKLIKHGINFVAPEGMQVYDYSRKGGRKK